jgi:hypothetical protein
MHLSPQPRGPHLKLTGAVAFERLSADFETHADCRQLWRNDVSVSNCASDSERSPVIGECRFSRLANLLVSRMDWVHAAGKERSMGQAAREVTANANEKLALGV